MKWLRWSANLAIVFLSSTFAHAITLPVTDDTNSNLSQSTQVNGANADVFVRNIGSGGARRAFVRFNTDVLPPGLTVGRAILKIWVDQIVDPGAFDIHLVTGAWDEGTLTASTEPSI